MPPQPRYNYRVKNFTVEKSGCWIWNGSVNKRDGYGRVWVSGSGRKGWKLAHRAIYESVFGKVSLSLDLDHLCRNRKCVNPTHLEPVTRRENLIRGIGVAAVNARKTECIRGHSLSGKNLLTVFNPTRKKYFRVCLKCKELRNTNRHPCAEVSAK